MFGIVLVPTGEHQKELYSMPASMARGEYVAQVYEGGMAFQAGMKPGDILYEIDQMAVSRRGQMFLQSIGTYVTMDGYLGRTALNSVVHCKVWREGKSVSIDMPYSITPSRAIPLIHEGALETQPYQIRGGVVITPLTQNYITMMTTPVTTGTTAMVPAPKLLKYSEYPRDRKEPRLVIANVVSSSLGEATKVFDSAMVIVKVNEHKVNTMEELCSVLSKPVKDPKGTEWLTIEVEDGVKGAMLMKEVVENDKKLAAMQLYTETTCPEDTAAIGDSESAGVPPEMAKRWASAAAHSSHN
jgi:hypothetical protein